MLTSILIFTQSFLNTLLGIYRLLFISNYRNRIKFQSIKENEIAIIGNGPSLNESFENNPNFFINRNLLCVNGFGFSPLYKKIKPSIYLFADPGMWIDNALPATIEFRDKISKIIIEETNWEMSIIVPFEARHNNIIQSFNKLNKNLKVNFYNNVKIMGFKWFRHRVFKSNLGIPTAQNVVIPSLTLALSWGYKKIFLLGADHNFHVNLFLKNDNVLCLKHEHFYGNDTELIPIRNVVTKENLKTHEFFESLVKTFKNYFVVKEFADYCRAEIINLSPSTFVDAFKRANIKDF